MSAGNEDHEKATAGDGLYADLSDSLENCRRILTDYRVRLANNGGGPLRIGSPGLLRNRPEMPLPKTERG